jgi:hypothetical protein
VLVQATDDVALAQDVVQAAFVRAYERIHQLDPARPFGRVVLHPAFCETRSKRPFDAIEMIAWIPSLGAALTASSSGDGPADVSHRGCTEPDRVLRATRRFAGARRASGACRW